MTTSTSTLAPVNDGTLGWIGWHRQVLAAEPVPRPVWHEQPPDIDTIRRRLAQEVDHASSAQQAAAQTLQYVRSAYRWAVASIVFPLTLLLALAVSSAVFEVTLPTTTSAEFSISPLVGAIAFVILFSPWVAAKALSARKRLSAGSGTLLRGLGLWILCAMVAPFVLGMSFVVIPVAVGVWVLLSRPKVFQFASPVATQAPESLLKIYRSARSGMSQSSGTIRSFDRRVRAEHDQAMKAYDQRHQQFLVTENQWSPFELVEIPEQQDILVIGGAAVERGDLLHHIGAAVEQQDQGFWVLDLEGRGTPSRLIAEAGHRGRHVSHLHAANEAATTHLLDGLDQISVGKRSLMVEVLAAGIAYDADGRVTSRTREVADTLKRLSAILREHQGSATVNGLHAALEVLLGRAEEKSSSTTVDDFGLQPATIDEGTDHTLSTAAVSAIRAAFTQQDRQQFHTAWTDVRVKIETILAHEGDEFATEAAMWDPHCHLSVCTIDLGLPPSDRELRTALLASHHVELLRSSPQLRPTALAVIGAEALPVDLLRHLSEVAQSVGTQLILMFGELVSEVQTLARGRRIVAAFGGHGATAAEELADLFGKDWTERLQNYQQTWSTSEATSRTETTGRNWSSSDSSGSSSSFGFWSDSTNQSRSSSNGDSASAAEGSTTTDQTGGTNTVQREYERRYTGAQISKLPPFTLLIKHGNTVRYADVKAGLHLPDDVVKGALATLASDPERLSAPRPTASLGMGNGTPQGFGVSNTHSADQTEPR
ncbi:MAG: hypothetical protein WBG89_03450 [Ornithinimicrobium sp.]